MKILNEYLVKHVYVRLEKGIDFDDQDLEKDRWLNSFQFRLKRTKADEIAKAYGYDESFKCHCITSTNVKFLNAEFIKKYEKGGT